MTNFDKCKDVVIESNNVDFTKSAAIVPFDQVEIQMV